MFGAIQYASGNDLRGTLTDSDKAASSGVNRAAKGDRASLITTQNEQSQTLSFRGSGAVGYVRPSADGRRARGGSNQE